MEGGTGRRMLIRRMSLSCIQRGEPPKHPFGEGLADATGCSAAVWAPQGSPCRSCPLMVSVPGSWRWHQEDFWRGSECSSCLPQHQG